MLEDEYLQRELDDACEVIAWLSRQPWCDGSVGMMGKSWGGFNALQMAALRPPALKAIITVCSTDDRYADDIHYMGGALLNDNLWWGAIMLAYQARPPDPALAATTGASNGCERLDAMPFFPALWLRASAPRRLLAARLGLRGFLRDRLPGVRRRRLGRRLYQRGSAPAGGAVGVPRLGLIGPWAHIYPQDGKPGPAIGFLQEALRWWDHWLKGRDDGVMAEPMLRAFIEERAGGIARPRPAASSARRIWPSPRIETRAPLGVDEAGSARAGAPARPIEIRSPCWTGAGCRRMDGDGRRRRRRRADQRLDDGFSRCFDSAPLQRAPGNPRRAGDRGRDRLRQARGADLRCGSATSRPDGSSRRVSYGVLNLTHRDSHAEPSALTPGEFYPIRLKLNDCGYAFAPGHRLRLALSTAYWPLIWPAPERATLTLRLPGEPDPAGADRPPPTNPP